MGLVALRHVGSSQTRDRTCVPCIGGQILNHCATREVPMKDFKCWDRCVQCTKTRKPQTGLCRRIRVSPLAVGKIPLGSVNEIGKGLEVRK